MKTTPTTQSNSVTFNTKGTKGGNPGVNKWWQAKSDKELLKGVLSTATYLKESQAYRIRQAAIYARLYGNISLFSFAGSNMTKLDQSTNLPLDRPTFNAIQSAIDTLVSRISQARPAPVFLTDNGDYKERNLAKKLNNFILGEFYQTKTYEKATTALRDALVEGTGCLKVYRTADDKVGVERVLLTELFTDPNEAIYGEPRQLHQVKLIDREVLQDLFPGKSAVKGAEAAYANNGPDSSKTVSDMVLVVESWRLPSGPDTKDGLHVISCSDGILLKEQYDKDKFPFVFLHYSPRLLGFWSQGVAEQLMGTQLEINSLLFTISKAIKLVGVPRVFVEEGSKVLNAAFNNDIGTIVKFRGVKPQYEVAPCVPAEMYAQLQRLIEYAFQQSGVSFMQASSVKPAGLNSGEAIRSYDDISSDRFATLSKRYDNVFVELAYQIIDLAKDIAEETGSYSTVFPNKNGVKEIDLPKASLLDNPFVIQCFNMSSLPRDPAGRLAKITEMIQAGMVTIREGRRLLDYPDLDQVEKLANASEERIFQYLDDIVEEGKYCPPDSFMDLALAEELTVQYYNLYVPAKLEEDRAEMLRTFWTQIQTIKQMAMPQAPMAAPAANVPQAQPMALPQSPLVPNMVQ